MVEQGVRGWSPVVRGLSCDSTDDLLADLHTLSVVDAYPELEVATTFDALMANVTSIFGLPSVIVYDNQFNTKLSEHMARSGKGAEGVARNLNKYFQMMVRSCGPPDRLSCPSPRQPGSPWQLNLNYLTLPHTHQPTR